MTPAIILLLLVLLQSIVKREQNILETSRKDIASLYGIIIHVLRLKKKVFVKTKARY